MKYEVVWEPSAECDLTEWWMRSRLRYVISRAVDHIDDELRRDPYACSESREAGRRVVYLWPLGISFTIDEKQRQVRVISVWQT
jgi:hypothetical protein